MKFLFTLISCFILLIAKAQDNLNFLNQKVHGPVELFNKPKANGQIIYASNDAYCPVSISLLFNFTNMAFSEGKVTLFVIPARSKRLNWVK